MDIGKSPRGEQAAHMTGVENRAEHADQVSESGAKDVDQADEGRPGRLGRLGTKGRPSAKGVPGMMTSIYENLSGKTTRNDT